jgi:hypothetical protein
MFEAFEKIISLIINKSDADDESNIYQSCPAFNPYIKDKVLTVPASCFKLITKDKTCIPLPERFFEIFASNK